MKEAIFIRQNMEKWKIAERRTFDFSNSSPDELVEAYTEVTADLAFAQTHYPNSRVTSYLNNLALMLHGELYHHKREKWSRLITFWTHEVPLAVYEGRKELRLSLIIFLVAVVMGIFTALGGEEYVRNILGDEYMDMTLNNIQNGEPMAVYNGEPPIDMFLGITLNNVLVSFICFVSGIFTSFATGYHLLQNGLMVGAFPTFFAQHGVLGECLLAMMLHGTLELSAIVIAGGAGIAMGNGWLFPGTYSRLESFRRSAKRGLKILVSIVPVLIVAAFIEGTFTRYTHVPDALRLTVILLSLLFVLYYYVYLPSKRHRDAERAA
ncbi:MAG: stage II sporulation protein M [Prevotella sp.]|nr:stage II sporulation protein M [Prevotella sp.]